MRGQDLAGRPVRPPGRVGRRWFVLGLAGRPIDSPMRRAPVTLDEQIDLYRQVAAAWTQATEAQQLGMLEDLRNLLDDLGFDDDEEYELREKTELLITELEDALGL